MAYEFTKQKIKAGRGNFVKRLAIAGLAAAVGLAIGTATNDLHSVVGLFCAGALAAVIGVACFYLAG